MNMITACAAAHPCVELVHTDNRVHWGTLFMLFIWQHTEKEAESCLDNIKKCNVVCILYLWVAMQRGILCCCKATSSSGYTVSLFRRIVDITWFFFPSPKSKSNQLKHAYSICIFHWNVTARSLICVGFNWSCTTLTQVLLASVHV